MNRIVIAVALSIALVACSHTSEQGKNYTITVYAPPRTLDDWLPVSIYFGYVHSEHAHDWEVYELSSSEVCAEQSDCWAIWFDGEAPESADELEEDEDRFVIVAAFVASNGEVVEAEVDCEFIDAPLDKASVECADGRIAF